jgi:hypothetical protein
VLGDEAADEADEEGPDMGEPGLLGELESSSTGAPWSRRSKIER